MTKDKSIATVPFWINGRETLSAGGRQGEVTNSATGAVVRHVSFATAEDVDRAVVSASDAWPQWSATSPLRRARVLMKARALVDHYKDELAQLITVEHGKTLPDALG